MAEIETVGPALIWFRRSAFHGSYSSVEPKWHIQNPDVEAPSKYGTYTGLCEYEFNNILGDLTLSRAKRGPTKGSKCGRCLRILQTPPKEES